ncbi:MAG TPA: hypothetical protein VK386_02145 [Acidimicrobiales bacterium]|nr:hypothetical protein [Acidimicrobiales bacterium]
MALIDVTPALGPVLFLAPGVPLLARGVLVAVTSGACAVAAVVVLASRRRSRSRS